MSLAQVAQKSGLVRTAVHAIETSVSGDHPDRLDAIAHALGARWRVELVDENSDERAALHDAVSAAPVELVGELLAVALAWSRLTSDDRDIILHLCERRARAAPVSAAPLAAVPTTKRRAE